MRGHVDIVNRNYVMGWAADPEHPNDEVKLIIYACGKMVATISATERRDDLKKAFSESTGMYAFRYYFDPPLPLLFSSEVQVVFAKNGQVVPNGRQTLAAIGTGEELQSKPILVTSTGRSGSSICMRRLAAHPQIAVAGKHPYEILLLSYYAYAWRTLTSEADRKRSLTPEEMGSAARKFSIGFNPFNDKTLSTHSSIHNYWNNIVPELLKGVFKNLILQYYQIVRAATGKVDVLYFAEKVQANPFVREFVFHAFKNVKEIVLIRDPRDIFCSYRAFWDSDKSSAIQSIADQISYMEKLYCSSQPDTLFVKYEDLVLNANVSMEAIAKFLDIDVNGFFAEGAGKDAFGGHGTSESPKASVGRWQTDLEESEKKACEAKFESFLTRFKY